jgi:hypothetical protein
MATTHFQAFMNAYATLDKRSRLLAGDYVLCPPSEDYGYQNTPRNALTFAEMGVDGVHYAILTIDGVVRDDSPVVQVSPMDSNDVIVLAGSFLRYLADGCRVSLQKMRAIFEAEDASEHKLVPFLSEHFDGSRLLGEGRIRKLTARYGHLVERKVECA